jgi:SnoaL-like protein
MRVMRKILAVLVALSFVVLMVYRATAGGSDAQSHAQDREQIEKLMWQYIRALDTESADAYAATFTPDGQFGSGANALKGRDALKKMIADLRQRTADTEAKTCAKAPAMYHVIANSSLDFTAKDHAHLEAYWMTVFAQAGPNVPVRVAAAGREVDELVRVNGQWLIKFRDVAPKD